MEVYKEGGRSYLTSDIQKHIPEKIIDREDQKKKFKVLVMNSLENGSVFNPVLLYGKPGSGKTLLTLKKINSASGIELEKVNCRNHRTNYRVIKKVAESLGYSDQRRPYYEDYLDYVRSFENSIVVILDEVDKLLLKEGNDNLVVSLARSNNIGLILISNHQNIQDLLSKNIQTMLGERWERAIKFPPYNRDDLLRILELYADKSLNTEAYTLEVLDSIARRVAMISGDARKAIEALRVSADLADEEGEPITEDLLDKSLHASDKYTLKEKLEDLSPHGRLLLLAIAKIQKAAISSKKSPFSLTTLSTTVDKIFEKYKETCLDYKIQPLKKWTLYKLLKSLERDGFITRSVKGRGKGKGTESVIGLEYSHNLVEEALKEIKIPRDMRK